MNVTPPFFGSEIPFCLQKLSNGLLYVVLLQLSNRRDPLLSPTPPLPLFLDALFETSEVGFVWNSEKIMTGIVICAWGNVFWGAFIQSGHEVLSDAAALVIPAVKTN